MVGAMKNDDYTSCTDARNTKALAGYRYITDEQIVFEVRVHPMNLLHSTYCQTVSPVSFLFLVAVTDRH